MAKKTTAKKPKRRLKKTVRRSLAVVMMITAVVVAAIPVPENIAAPDDDTTSEVEPNPYSYPESLASTVTDKRNLGSPIIRDDDGNIVYDDDNNVTYEDGVELFSAYVINPLSDGTYQMDWQFKFKTIYINNNNRGVITEYNNSYAQNTVELMPNVVRQYATFSEADFENFFIENPDQGTSTVVEYTCTNPANLNAAEEKFFNTYFKSAFDAHKVAYTQYQQQYQAWLNAGGVDSGSSKPSEPELIRKSSDLTPDQRYQYFCDGVRRTNNTLTNVYPDGKYAGYRLATVIDSSQSTATNPNNVRVYIPQTLSKTKEHEMDDSQGFGYEADASIIGIADQAFRDTKNVLYLTVPDEIKYIGESAFENSFLKEITLINVEKICDRAFKDCNDLTKVTMQSGVVEIGTECFYDTGVRELIFPSSMQKIGHGAFASCNFLQKVDFSQIAGTVSIGDYAFYNDVGLNEVNVLRTGSQNVTVSVSRIGDGAFAIEDGVTGNMTEFLFPTTIKQALGTGTNDIEAEGMGDFLFAGRTNLLHVTMPADFGRNTTPKAEVPDNIFYNCFNLEYIHFPDSDGSSCGFATYNSDKLFATVSNPDFYVWGPELNNRRDTASPRKATWDAKTALWNDETKTPPVPYLYIRNGLNYYEISNGEYLMCVDNEGVLTSCTRKDTSQKVENVPLTIPAEVAGKTVTGIASDCFTDTELNNNITSLTIEDNSEIARINNSVCNGWENLKKVYIGNSVTFIGDYAFANCNKLTDVTFSSPKAGHEAFAIGTDAFKTGSGELFFHGDIVKGYQPFEWAMDKDNVIKEPEGIRVCYQSLAPSLLTVMYDEETELITLLDYPRTNQVSGILRDLHEKELRPEDNKSYEKMRMRQSYDDFSGSVYDSRRDEFKAAWIASGGSEEVYNSESYGPWVNPWFVETYNTWENTPSEGDGSTDSASSRSIMQRAADFLFEPIVAYAVNEPKAYYDQYPFILGVSNYPYPALTAEEISLLNSVKNIEVPEGIGSIDVYGYYAASDRNKNNAHIYLEDKVPLEVWRMYTSKTGGVQPGLFSGMYDDGMSAADGEQYKPGNDQITSVVMHSVKYLPNYAFDNCENLQTVTLGDACMDIGIAPFRSCYALYEMVGNSKYVEENGIVFSNESDGSSVIEECFASRGKPGMGKNWQSAISYLDDPRLSEVSKIKPGAFEDCDVITSVDFGRESTAGLLEIPEDCFKDCEELYRIVLPMTVNDIGREAFAGSNKLSDLTIYGKEVKISGYAFGKELDPGKTITRVRAYEDSAAARYVKEYGEDYRLELDRTNPLGEMWEVTFLGPDYKTLSDLVDRKGNALKNPQYVEDGKEVTVPAAPVVDGWTFERWVGMNGAEEEGIITEDTFFYAKGFYENGTVDGNYTVEFFDGIDGSQQKGFGAAQDGKFYVPAGSTFAELGIEPPPFRTDHAGFRGLVYSGNWTVDTVISSNMQIILLYEAETPSGDPNGTTSGTSTSNGTTSNGTTSSGSTSRSSSSNKSTSSSSSSTSSSSTSSSSTSATSGAGQYTVFVDGGSGSGSYAPGTTVIISAYVPAEGMRFSHWTTDSNGVTLASASMSSTTFTMPANNVTVKANYVADTAAAPAAPSTGGNSGTRTDNDNGNGNTRVDIEKPGISNRDLATATVNGSTDNFIVKITETDEATRAVAAALTNKYGTLDNILYYAMDISLYDSTGTTKISDTTGLTIDITIPIPDSLVAYGGNNMAGAVINGDQLESLNESFTTINGVPCIRFRATHFSPYTIYVDTGNLVEGMLDTTPKTGDPIHPKWFLSLGLACLSVILFLKKDKKAPVKVKGK